MFMQLPDGSNAVCQRYKEDYNLRRDPKASTHVHLKLYVSAGNSGPLGEDHGENYTPATPQPGHGRGALVRAASIPVGPNAESSVPRSDDPHRDLPDPHPPWTGSVT